MEEKSISVAQNRGRDIEYAASAVPASARKIFGTILVILTGYCISLSNFVTGATIGSQMEVVPAILAAFVGNSILAFVATMLGVIGAESGKTTLILARNSLGKRGSVIMSMLITLSAINWIAVNANTFADLILVNFRWWPFGMEITACITVALWALSALRGAKDLEVISWMGVPVAIMLVVASFVAIENRAGYAAAAQYIPVNGSLSFATGSTSIVGAWIFGCIVTPDVTRYAKNKKHAAIAAPLAVYVGLFTIEVVGILTAQATNQNNFVHATAALDLGVLVFFCAIFCAWTTQDNNIYSASLSLRNIFESTKLEGKLKHVWRAWIVAIVAAVFASYGALQYLIPVIRTLSVLLPPLPAIIIAEHWFVKNSKEDQRISWSGIIVWAVASVVGMLAIKLDFLIPAAVSMVVAFVLYIAVGKKQKISDNL